MKKLIAVLLLAMLAVGSVVAQDNSPVPGSGLVNGPLAGEAQDLTGAGATFPAVLYTAWFSDYAALTGVQINYQAIGSGGGIKAVTDGTTDFGASDAPMTDDQLEAAKATCGPDPMLHIPTALGGVAITYNLPDLPDAVLRFTPETLVAIFDGTVNTWNDPALVVENPELADVAQPIAVVHRSDGSGTTNIMTSYLASVSEDWATNVGSGTSVKWPTGIGQKGNSGVAGAIAGVPYAIGYVELAYAVQNDLPVSLVQNQSGNFLQPRVDTVSAAAAGVTLPDDLRIMVVNSANPYAYPITGFTWIWSAQCRPTRPKRWH